MHIKNSGLIAKTKASKYKKGLCLTKKLVCLNPLLFLYYPLSFIKQKHLNNYTKNINHYSFKYYFISISCGLPN